MSEIRTDTINNASGDNDSGIDLSTNDQVIIKTANTTAVTVDSSQNTTFAGSVDVVGASGAQITVTDNSPSTVSLFMGAGNSSVSVGSTTSDPVTFLTNNLERARVDSSGNLLVKKTAHNFQTAGFQVEQSSGETIATRASGTPLNSNRLTNDGEIFGLLSDNVSIGSMSVFAGRLCVGADDTALKFDAGNDSIMPFNIGTGANRDNAVDLGYSSVRWDDIYATNGTIQTSDRNEKQDIEELSEAEQRVAVVAKGLMRKFRWRDAVAEKGDNARTHFGIIAQDLQDAFTAEGLDASKYAMFTSNTWWEKEISVDAVEADEENGIEAKDAYTYIDTKEEATEGYTEKTRLGVRYNQLLAFIISAL